MIAFCRGHQLGHTRNMYLIRISSRHPVWTVNADYPCVAYVDVLLLISSFFILETKAFSTFELCELFVLLPIFSKTTKNVRINNFQWNKKENKTRTLRIKIITVLIQ